jgi:hypothetical protein
VLAPEATGPILVFRGGRNRVFVPQSVFTGTGLQFIHRGLLISITKQLKSILSLKQITVHAYGPLRISQLLAPPISPLLQFVTNKSSNPSGGVSRLPAIN